MADIILTTLNARYIHASLGLRYLLANMGELQPSTTLMEFTIQQQTIDMAEKLLRENPRIIGIGCYIWNVRETEQLVNMLKSLHPEIIIILGGPEVSYEAEQQTLTQQADYIVSGMADLRFAELCREILSGQPPEEKFVRATPPALADIRFPYDFYTEEDLRHRLIYIEASRGCPFKCEFCLSSLDKTAWPFDLNDFLCEMEKLYQRGARNFKFVDRTFNLKIDNSIRILRFFLERMSDELFLHFEVIPDHLPEKLREWLVKFPPGSLQFEIGIQTFNPEVQQLISRKQDNEKSKDNIHWLREHSHAHLHTDLILGLPGESMQSMADGFNQLVDLAPHEIQVGILKRLRGSPIIRHTDPYKMVYNPSPPYNILSNNIIDFNTMQRLNRFARYWDIIGNSGRFSETLPLILADNPFTRFMKLADWLYATTDQTHQIALARLFNLLHEVLIKEFAMDSQLVEEKLLDDYQRSKLKGLPGFARKPATTTSKQNLSSLSSRQHRHNKLTQ